MNREQVIRMEQLFGKLRDLLIETDDEQKSLLIEEVQKNPRWIFLEAELNGTRLGKQGEIKGLQSVIYQYFEEEAELKEKLKVAEETLQLARTQRDDYERQVWDFKNALINRDHEFSEVKEKLDEAEKAVIYLTELSDDVKGECVKTQQGLYSTAKELAEVNKILDKAQNQLRLTVETMAAFRKSTPSEKSFVALMKALENNFGLESRDIGKSKKKKK